MEYAYLYGAWVTDLNSAQGKLMHGINETRADEICCCAPSSGLLGGTPDDIKVVCLYL